MHDAGRDFCNLTGSTIQLFLREGDKLFPAVRLSDGTQRHLALLAILSHPSPPPLATSPHRRVMRSAR